MVEKSHYFSLNFSRFFKKIINEGFHPIDELPGLTYNAENGNCMHKEALCHGRKM